jgi:hypothetical protein
MDWVLLGVLGAAVLFALLRGAGVGDRPDLGWVAIALVIFGVWFLPVLWRLRGWT